MAQPKAKRLNQQQDRIWVQSMAAMTAFMLLVVGYRWYQERQPPEIRYGLSGVVAGEQTGGQVVLRLNNAPALSADGGAVVVRAGNLEAFVVRLPGGTYAVFDCFSAQGERVKYDIARGLFAYLKDETVGFDRSSGACLTSGVEDRLLRYISIATPETVEFQTNPQ
ncbi:MAG: hypothetical protein IT204_02975 [Fimbriimonadaceae bacterium]|nr:hypothetical protein [Fimbriimonadaceae bacterium]